MKCQHDWLSLPFCTMSPNHRVAVAKKAPNYELPAVASCQKEKALNSRVAPRLPSANPNNVFNDRKKYSSELFCKSGISFEEGAGRVEMECQTALFVTPKPECCFFPQFFFEILKRNILFFFTRSRSRLGRDSMPGGTSGDTPKPAFLSPASTATEASRMYYLG